MAAGLPKLKAGLWLDSCAGLGANKPAPPVLAPNEFVDGGGPAGVVEGLLKLKRPPPEVVAGVVEPNNEGAEVVGVEDLSGVPKPEKRDLGASPLLFSSALVWPNLNPPALAAPVFPKMLGEAGLFPVDAGCDGAPKLKAVVLPPGGAAAPVFPNKLPPEPAGLFVVPNSPWPVVPLEDAGAPKLKGEVMFYVWLLMQLLIDLGNGHCRRKDGILEAGDAM